MIRRIAVLVVVAVTWLGLPVLPASGRAPSTDVRQEVVTGWTRDAGWRVSPVHDARDVQVVGASWTGSDVAVELRLREGGTWSPWRDLERPSDVSEGPDAGSDEDLRAPAADASLPVPVTGAEAFQVRSSDRTDVTLELVEVDDNGYTPSHLRSAAADASASRPGIVPRGSWDPNGECQPRVTPRYASDVRFAVVHHTAGSNSYSRSDAWKQVLGVCKFHRHTLGWDDIGYNLLVDRYGTVYEGRAGGLQQAVVGAHTAGFNRGSTGVSVLGCFNGRDCSGDTAPTQAVRDALVATIAWKLDTHHVDPRGTTTEVSGGGGSTTVPAGQAVTVRTIIGHQDVAATACPGDRLYPWVRNDLPGLVRQAMVPAMYGGPNARDEQPVIGERPRWDVTIDPAAAWDLTITDRAGRLVRATSGVGSSLDRSWDLRDAAGREVSPGAYRARLSAPGTDTTPIETVFQVVPAVERREGEERIATSIALSRWAFSDPVLKEQGFPQSDDVIVAAAEAYPDALVATTLAGSYGAPILLARYDGVPPEVADEIRRLGARKAYVIGGHHRLPEGVLDQLRGSGLSVERLAGETRYHTAGKVAWRVIEREDPREVLLALGQHPDPRLDYQDALVAGAFGGAEDLPVLLVHPRALTEPSDWVLRQRSWSGGVTVVGGRGGISEPVRAQARDAARVGSLRDLAGDGHYDTSRIVADELLRRRSQGPPDPHDDADGLEVVLATGENWPDALGAGAAAVVRDAAFLLVHNRDLAASAPTRAWLTGFAGSLVHAVAAGGPEAIADRVLTDVERTIRSDGPHRRPAEPW